MPSSPSFPVCRIDWRPDPHVTDAIPAMAVLGLFSIALSGLPLPAQGALTAFASLYAIAGFRRYRAQKPFQLMAHADGALWMVQGGRFRLEHAVWRDWGYLIEFSGRLDGKRRRCFWLTGNLDAVPLRRLRLLSRATREKAAVTLPSIITNPVL